MFISSLLVYHTHKLIINKKKYDIKKYFGLKITLLKVLNMHIKF